MVKHFKDAFRSDNSEVDQKLENLLHELEAIPHSFCGLVWLYEHDFIYMSSSVERVLGHTHTRFQDHGLLFFQSITPFRLVDHIFGELSLFLNKLETHPLYMKAPLLSVVNAALVSDRGEEIPIVHYASFIDVKPTQPASYLILGVWVDTRKFSSEELLDVQAHVSPILLEIKSCYNRLYPERVQYFNLAHNLTQREREIIVLLAGGLSTKAISEKLGISFNTVESHRKNLLTKFNAHNTAELISMASKVIQLQ